MDHKLQEIYDSTSRDEGPSKLQPYRELVLRWRRDGKPYRTISRLLEQKCGLQVSPTAVYQFIQRRSRPRKATREVLVEEEAEQVASRVVEDLAPTTSSTPKLSAEARAARVEFIRSLNNKPVVEEQPKTGWNFAVDKPRTIQKS